MHIHIVFLKFWEKEKLEGIYRNKEEKQQVK